MTGRELYLRTFRGEPTDRMPVSLFIMEQGHFLSELYPHTDPQDHEQQFRDLLEFYHETGADPFFRLLSDLYDPAPHVMYGGVDIWQQAENWEVNTTERRKDRSRVLCSTIRTPGGTLEQEFSINEIRPGTFMYACTKFPVSCEEDLDLVIAYEPPMPAGYPAHVAKAAARTKALVGDEGIVAAWVPYGFFNNCSHLVPLDDLYCMFLSEPEFYQKLAAFSLRRFQPYTQAILDTGVDVACMGGNVPGGFLGKSFYDQYVLPYEKQAIAFTQKSGTVAMYHNCGEIMNLVESYRELGTISVEPFSPYPLGDTDLEKALTLIDGAYTVTGGIDQINLIQNGSVEQVAEATRRTAQIGHAKGKGRFILQNADFLEYGTPVENVKAFVDTALECAWY